LLIGRAACAATAEYLIAVDASLDALTVEARFAAPVRDIAARSQSAKEYLGDARNCANNTPIAARGRRLVIPDAGLRCLSYSVDLRRAAASQRGSRRLDPATVCGFGTAGNGCPTNRLFRE